MLKVLFLLVKKGNIWKTFGVSMCIILVCLAYNLPSIVELLKPTTERPSVLASSKDLKISNEDLQVISQYMDSGLQQIDDSVKLVLLYKFIPQGNTFLYQGRVVVNYTSYMDVLSPQSLIKETGLLYIPMWTSKNVMTRVLDGETVKVFFSEDGKESMEDGLPLKDTPSLKFSLLFESGITDGIIYPVFDNGVVIGYLFFMGNNVKNVNGKAKSLGDRLAHYMVRTQS